MEVKKALAFATQLAKLDKEANGHYANAPYQVGEYKAKIQYSSDSKSVRLVLIRPEQSVGTAELPNDNDNLPIGDSLAS